MSFDVEVGPNEERYVLAETFIPQTYAMPYVLRLEGKLEMAKLNRALALICAAQPALRTGFRISGDGEVQKYVTAKRHAAFECLSIPGASLAEVRARLRPEFFAKPSFTPGDLSRFFIVSAAANLHYLAFSHHHAISDGVSLGVFLKDLFDLYAAPDLEKTSVVERLPPTWRWRDTPDYATSLAYWREALRDAETDEPIPADIAHDRAAAGSTCLELVIDASVAAEVAATSAALGISEFTLFYGASITALARMVGKMRIATAFQSDGRRDHPSSEGLIGAFSNTLVNATRVDETLPARAFLEALREDIRQALHHSVCPYHHIIRETGVHPRFGVNWYPVLPALKAPDLAISPPDMLERQSDYDLNLRFVAAGDQRKLLIYHPTGLSAARIAAFGETAIGIARAIAANPDAPLTAAPSRDLAPPALLPDWHAELPQGVTEPLYARFAAHAVARPEKTAIIHGSGTFSYGDVDARANALARRLAAAGIGTGARVLILADRAPWLIWSMLAVSRTGAAFVVIDSAYPSQRIAVLANICAPHAILCDADGQGATTAAELATLRRVPLILADAGSDAQAGSVGDVIDPEQPAYLLFTSGSTGTPKCVACSHRPLVNFIRWQQMTFGLDTLDRFTMLSGLSHDPLLRDVFTPLSIGAMVLIPDHDDIYEPGRLAAWFSAAAPTVSHMTPAMAQLLTAGRHRQPPLATLQHVFMGGDMLRAAQAEAVRKVAPNTEIINFYGSTETPQAAAWHRWDGCDEATTVPIGYGSDGFQIGILDDGHELKGVGELGDIAVRSNLLSMGYVVDGATVEADDRLEDAFGRPTIYRTGDRGYLRPDGAVAIVGRRDDQIKVRGYRVDLSEVTAALTTLPGVHAAIALAVGSEGDGRIRGFVAGPDPDAASSLLNRLAEKLPGYMMPESIVTLEALPLLPNGKIDRQSLIALEIDPPSATVSRLETARERRIAEAWSVILGRQVTSNQQSFAMLGGDSLSYVQGYLATEEILGSLPDGWQFLPISALAAVEPIETGRNWRRIDTALVVRALSITAVVAAHFGLLVYSGGATSALFLVSGFMFGGFQLSEAVANRSGGPVMRLFARVFVPAALVSWLLYASKVYQGKLSDVSTALFYSNFVSPFVVGNDFYLWYVHCVLQILLVLWVLIELRPRLPVPLRDPFGFSTAVFTTSALVKFTLPAFFIPGFYTGVIGDLDIANYVLSTHLPTFALGMMVATANTRYPKVATLLAAWLYAALTLAFYYSHSWIVMAVAAPLLIFLPRIPMWRPLCWPIFALSGASLFIYLTHIKYFWFYELLGIAAWPALNTALALAGGVITWLVWQRLWGFALRRMRFERHPEDALAAA